MKKKVFQVKRKIGLRFGGGPLDAFVDCEIYSEPREIIALTWDSILFLFSGRSL